MKKVANNHVTDILERFQKAENLSFCFFFFFVTPFMSRDFSGNIADRQN